ncbi:MAG: DUF1553 domain-containing protein [Saprospiraceae bacterium]|nr:DUF1553 domain-containing protein [Saprospiraceae bacterium]
MNRRSKILQKIGYDTLTRLIALPFLALLIACGQRSLPPEVAERYNRIETTPDFNQDIRPILSDRCFSCHGPDQGKLEAGLRLDVESIAKGKLSEHPDLRAIVPGNLHLSELVNRILSTDPEHIMPPVESKLSLNPDEKALLIRWIEDGAIYMDHWAFIPPKKTALPDANHPVDYFIEKRFQAQKLKFNEEADRETLLRRLSFDLTGLPPSIEVMDSFLADNQDGAYERLVDRLLDLPEYGERMAVDWMDVARYADTHGYTVDRYRDVSPWRDWVIESFNENMPYDQFVTLQLAGDLVPGSDRSEKIATTFLRLHPQNMEGGIVPEEFRVEYVSDRTNTFGTAFMGMTLGCAKCHDHKFDPISQKDYYQLFSFFNNVNESGQISWNDATPVPTMLLSNPHQDSLINFLNQKIADLETEKLKIAAHLKISAEDWIDKTSYKTMDIGRQESHHLAQFDLNGNLKNKVNPRQSGKMDRNNSSDEKPSFGKGKEGQGLLMDGDAWLDLGGVGVFERYESFSVGLSLLLPDELKDGVILHKGNGAVLYNFRGFHLALKDHRLELLMAHTAPDNAIIRYANEPIPRDQWIQLTLVYDGSGRADALNVFLGGKPLEVVTDSDNLYKSILFKFSNEQEPGIQIGARWRGKGIGGAVIDNVFVFDRSLTNLEIMKIANSQAFVDIINKSPRDLVPEERANLVQYYTNYHQTFLDNEIALRHAREALCKNTDTIKELMVYKEMDLPRPAFILDRGQYDAYKERVTSSTPRAIMALDSTVKQPTRLELAKWLTAPEHPLTARVMVNRIWQQLFGRGIVKTAEDFGNQGVMPTHPDLLDHLAVTFQENGWNIKELIKLLVTSRTYRQSSIVNLEKRQSDPENILYARGPSRRLSAEMIRDQALAASGLLVKKLGGPSVSPYQPEGLWRVNGAAYVQSKDDDLYRRSLYTIWKRSVPHPTQSTFDAPGRSECSMRRQQTNTPLQALVLMNDPIFVESARAIGKEMQYSEDIGSSFRKLTGRHPKKEEVVVLLDLFEQYLSLFNVQPERAMGWLGVQSEKKEDLQLAAYAVVASTIINSDAFITKR